MTTWLICVREGYETRRVSLFYVFVRCFDFYPAQIALYYMEESVLLGTKPLVDSIRHFIRDPSGVFSVCHLECRIVQ